VYKISRKKRIEFLLFSILFLWELTLLPKRLPGLSAGLSKQQSPGILNSGRRKGFCIVGLVEGNTLGAMELDGEVLGTIDIEGGTVALTDGESEGATVGTTVTRGKREATSQIVPTEISKPNSNSREASHASR